MRRLNVRADPSSHGKAPFRLYQAGIRRRRNLPLREQSAADRGSERGRDCWPASLRGRVVIAEEKQAVCREQPVKLFEERGNVPFVANLVRSLHGECGVKPPECRRAQSGDLKSRRTNSTRSGENAPAFGAPVHASPPRNREPHRIESRQCSRTCSASSPGPEPSSKTQNGSPKSLIQRPDAGLEELWPPWPIPGGLLHPGFGLAPIVKVDRAWYVIRSHDSLCLSEIALRAKRIVVCLGRRNPARLTA